MTGSRLYYLGPEGTFTHQAAHKVAEWAERSSGRHVELEQCVDVPTMMRMVQSHRGWCVTAWENNVEGYVVPNLDGLIDAQDAVGVARVGVDIAFDAFTTRAVGSTTSGRRTIEGDGIELIDGWEVVAHPHGLAQCAQFIARHQLVARPATSNAAACRDLQPGQVALGPSLCGELYNLNTIAAHVEDYRHAHTEFLVLAPREDALSFLQGLRRTTAREFETIVAFIPLSTGPGVLANLLDVLRDQGLNMTSFISRPIKGHDGTYSFVATIDAAPWQPALRTALRTVIKSGSWVKTLAVYERREHPSPPVDAWMLPVGGVHDAAGSPHRGHGPNTGPDNTDRAADGSAVDEAMTREELLW